MFITKSEVAIILRLPIKQFKSTPAGHSGNPVGVHGKITIKHGGYGSEGVG